jgi:hypothetical protein
MRAGMHLRSLHVFTRKRIGDAGQGAREPLAMQRRAAKRKDAQGHEASHATVSGADLEQLRSVALFCAKSALRGPS